MTSATTAHPTIRASVRHHTMAPRANTMTIRTVDASMISTDQSCARSATAVGGRTDHATAINTRAATSTVTTTAWDVLVMMEASSVHRLRIRMTYYSPSAGLVEPSTAALVALGWERLLGFGWSCHGRPR